MTTYCGNRGIFLLPVDDWASQGINSFRNDVYQINAADDATALSLLKTTAPASRTVDSILLDAPPKFKLRKQKGFGRYQGTVSYTHPGRDDRQENDLIDTTKEKLSFDFTIGGQFFSQAKSQDRYPSSGSDAARDVGNFLNVNSKGEPAGYDFSPPSDSFTVEKVFDEASITNAFLKTLYGARLSVNDAIFRSLDPGDCIFLGFSGHQQSNGDFPISLKFGVAIGETVSSIAGISLGGPTTIKGFQYVWVMSRPKADISGTAEVTGTVTPEAVGVYIATLFDEFDFSTFGIAT